MAFDPAYWYDGLTFDWNPRNNGGWRSKSLKSYGRIFQVEFSLLLGLMALYGLRGRRSGWLKSIAGAYPLLIPALAALSLFAS